jgi:ABC-type ATPase with predicted acetyltransferase domain
MSNGVPVKIPAFAAFLGGGVSVSNTAVLIGAGLIGLGVLVHTMWSGSAANKNRMKMMAEMSPVVVEQQIFDDVQDYSAYPGQVTSNADRIMDAIRRSASLKELSDDYIHNIMAVLTAYRSGLITITELRAKLQKAREDYVATIREKWKIIVQELGIGLGHTHLDTVPSNR